MRLDQIHLRDPFVLTAYGEYCMYGTGACVFSQDILQMTAYRSSDLRNWTAQCVSVDMTGIGASGDFWAPDVFAYQGRYYLFLTLSAAGRKRGTYVFVSDTPWGKFSPVSVFSVTPPEKQCLDATLYLEDGIPYLLYSWEWLEAGSGKIYIRRMKEDLSACVGEEHELLDAEQSGACVKIGCEWNGGSVEGYVTDSPALYKTSGGRYLLMWSSFGEAGYHISLAVSDRLFGPYRQEKHLFCEDGGHAMIFRTYGGDDYISFHTPNAPPDERPVFYAVTEQGNSFVLSEKYPCGEKESQ